jgi:hypothetical protein
MEEQARAQVPPAAVAMEEEVEQSQTVAVAFETKDESQKRRADGIDEPVEPRRRRRRRSTALEGDFMNQLCIGWRNRSYICTI